MYIPGQICEALRNSCFSLDSENIYPIRTQEDLLNTDEVTHRTILIVIKAESEDQKAKSSSAGDSKTACNDVANSYHETPLKNLSMVVCLELMQFYSIPSFVKTGYRNGKKVMNKPGMTFPRINFTN